MKFFIIFYILFNLFKPNYNLLSQNNQGDNYIKVLVNGLVCDFCARSIEKTFGKEDIVESVNVDLEKMLVTILIKENSDLDDSLIIKLINDSGYDVSEIYRVK
tara:strand:- start:177 stop:485 length:309 start_codon:yes stop_codon:yes gene_type:complete